MTTIVLLIALCYPAAIDQLVLSQARSDAAIANRLFEEAGDRYRAGLATDAEWESRWQNRYDANQRLAEIEFDMERTTK